MRIGALVGLVGLGLVLVVPGGALAHSGVDTPQGHAAEDSVVLTPSAESQLSRESAQKNAIVRATMAAVTGDPGVVGQWGPVVDWPVVAVNAALLPNGNVLAYDSIGDQATETYPVQDHTRATVWDPRTGSQTDVTLSDGFNIFCSGFSFLPNGNLFIAGGNKDQQLDGIVQTHYFDWSTGTWSLGVNMAYARWYPTVTGMSNNEMLITSGGPAIPEVRQSDGTLRQLSNASLSLPLYPWFDVAPDGRAFDSGPDQTMRSLDPSGTGAWQIWSSRDSINRDYGGHAMYDVGKILVAGGGPSTNTADVINLNGVAPTVTPTGSMAYGRRQNNLTVLADGTVLATGGNSSGASLVDMNAGVYAAELWNPASGQWTTLSSMQVTRQYHSTALLLPDGRVLSAGGGICGTCDTVGYLNKNAEIFSPPYLFAKDGSGSLASRPTVAAAPATVSEGGQFTVSTPDAASIKKVALVKLGAVTHSNNMDQRYVPLSFTAGNGTLTVTAPANVNIAPPGYYMLFIVNSAGVPSVAPILNVIGVPPTVQITAPASGSTFSFKSDITIKATASDSDGTVQKVEFFAGATKLGQSTTTPYSFVWHRPGPGTYALTAKATDNAGLMTTSAPVTVTVSRHG
ncbi:MAG TPA: galactose oxidase-like domain-containing protein [Solirubrobacteraceae bacterium]|nr:galactose oxidase-like domain-containing protein [Solirubrobacteraceae bacterium]